MLEFKPITAADGVWARPLLLKADCISCGYTFANLFVWSTVPKRAQNALCILSL